MTQLAPADADTPTSDLNPEAAMDAALEEEMDGIFGSDDEAPKSEPSANDAPQKETQENTSESTPSDEADAPQIEDTDGKDDVGDDPQQEDAATLEAPARWDASQRELWSKAPPEIQEVILAREKQNQAYVTQQAQELAQAKLEVHELKTQPDTELSRLIQMQTARLSQYADATPENLLAAINDGRITPEDARTLSQLKAQEEQELQTLQQYSQAREQEQLQEHVQRETLLLQSQNPELATKESLVKVMGYLKENGVSDDDLKWIDARSVILADKARQFDELQAARAKSKPAPVKTGKATRSASSNEGDSRAALMRKLSKSTKPKDLNRLADMQADAEFDAFFGA